MLVTFRVKNFLSFDEPQTFSMIADRYRKNNNHKIQSHETNLLRFSSLYGANSSGKSNFVQAIAISKHMVHRGKMPRVLGDMHFKAVDKQKTSAFEFELLLGDYIFAYGFAVDFSKRKIVREYLYRITPSTKREQVVFDLDNETGKSDIDQKKFSGSEDDKARIRTYMNDFHQQQEEFFLARAAKSKFEKQNSITKALRDVWVFFWRHLIVIKPHSRPLNLYSHLRTEKDTPKDYISAIDILRTFDTGIREYEFKKMGIEDFVKQIRKDAPESEKKAVERSTADMMDHIRKTPDKKIKSMPVIADVQVGNHYYQLSYNEKDDKIYAHRITFKHYGSDAIFSYNEESDGTKRLIELLNILHSVQLDNITVVIDEIDRSLHTNLTLAFVKKFINLSQKTKSQLIVTSHETALMNLDHFRQDEIWIINRNEKGASLLKPLSDYNVRTDLATLEKNYLLGRYKGVPNIPIPYTPGSEDCVD